MSLANTDSNHLGVGFCDTRGLSRGQKRARNEDQLGWPIMNCENTSQASQKGQANRIQSMKDSEVGLETGNVERRKEI